MVYVVCWYSTLFANGLWFMCYVVRWYSTLFANGLCVMWFSHVLYVHSYAIHLCVIWFTLVLHSLSMFFVRFTCLLLSTFGCYVVDSCVIRFTRPLYGSLVCCVIQWTALLLIACYIIYSNAIWSTRVLRGSLLCHDVHLCAVWFTRPCPLIARLTCVGRLAVCTQLLTASLPEGCSLQLYFQLIDKCLQHEVGIVIHHHPLSMPPPSLPVTVISVLLFAGCSVVALFRSLLSHK